jgi:hypothetical protein
MASVSNNRNSNTIAATRIVLPNIAITRSPLFYFRPDISVRILPYA